MRLGFFVPDNIRLVYYQTTFFILFSASYIRLKNGGNVAS